MPDPATIYLSPLRYPGGKSRLAPFVAAMIRAQPRAPRRYVEPFAGGAGVGLRLLFDEHVDEIVLNDLNPGVAAFWRSVFDAGDDFASLVRRCRPNLEEWFEQRTIYEEWSGGDDLTLGFATFFLNRTNRSGILDARPIGGLNQNGKWKIDARWEGEKLAARIELLAGYATRVEVTEEDGIDLVRRTVNDADTFTYADPPYMVEGEDLYLDTLQPADHARLAAALRRSAGWLLTYDADDRVLELYDGLRCAEFSIAHTAAVQHIGEEYAVFANSLVLPPLEWLGHGGARLLPS